MPIPQSLTVGRLPIIGAPMFLVSSIELVVAQCCAGIIGCFPSLNARSPEELRQWIQQIKRACREYQALHPESVVASFGVNIVSLSKNQRMADDLAICIEEQVPLIITSLQPPKGGVRIRDYGGVLS